MSVCHLRVETSIHMKCVETLCWIKATRCLSFFSNFSGCGVKINVLARMCRHLFNSLPPSGTNSSNQLNKNGISKRTHHLQTINVHLQAASSKKGMNTPHGICKSNLKV